MKFKFNNIHLVDSSPWPLLISFSVMGVLIVLFNLMMNNPFLEMSAMNLIGFFLIFFLWTRDIIRESTFQGNHSLIIMSLLKIGLILFIISEVMFFFSFFWTFFHNILSPSVEIGMKWPSEGISSINPFTIPLLNTLILVSSGVSITYAHLMLMSNNLEKTLKWTLLTVLLGIYFTILQFFEYVNSSFSIMDSIYGSIFFMATGFHGIHVLVGTTMIFSSLLRMNSKQFSSIHHLMFEFSCWYWHFVDFIWLFLYLFLYWWGY